MAPAKRPSPPSPLLVTGCAGFIGARVSALLLQQGCAVVGVDNLNDAYDRRLKEWRLEQLQGYPGFRFHRLDITDREAVGLLRGSGGHNFAAVLHLAARAGVRQSMEDPWVFYRTNVEGTLNMLELCRVQGVPKIILASTSSVYGDAQRPFREDMPTDRPLSPYAASKKAAENLCFTYHRLHGLAVAALRYFTVYGPAGRPDMSVFRFIKWIAEGEPLVVYGDGSQERDFTYVDDIAQGTVLALQLEGHHVINLGSDRPAPLTHLVATLEQLLGKKARLEHHPTNPADVQATWADISSAQQLLGWKPATDLLDGLSRAVDWYLQNRTWAKGCVGASA